MGGRFFTNVPNTGLCRHLYQSQRAVRELFLLDVFQRSLGEGDKELSQPLLTLISNGNPHMPASFFEQEQIPFSYSDTCTAFQITTGKKTN